MNDEQDLKRLIKDFATNLQTFVKLRIKSQTEMENYFNSLELPASSEVSLKGLTACWNNDSKAIINCKYQTRNVSLSIKRLLLVHLSLQKFVFNLPQAMESLQKRYFIIVRENQQDNQQGQS